MNRGIIRRLEFLESQKPNDLKILAYTTDEQEVVEMAKNVIKDDGTLRKGYSGIGRIRGGNSLADLDLFLNYFRVQAYKVFDN